MRNQVSDSSNSRSSVIRTRAALLFFLLVAFRAHPSLAQQGSQTITGRVVADDGRAIAGAEVIIVRAPDRRTWTVRSDSSGHYGVAIPDPTGDYLIHAQAAGWRPFRQRVTRADSAPITLDIKLVSAVVHLAPMMVRGQRLLPPRSAGLEPSVGAAEQLVDGMTGAVDPQEGGNLAAIASTVPGVTRAADGITLLGLSGQSNTTLNGMAFAAGEIPRDARTRVRVSSSTYDPTRGGFGSGQIAVELGPGGPFTTRRLRFTGDSPLLQARAGVDHGERRFGGLQVSANTEGEMHGGRVTYNLAAQAARRVSEEGLDARDWRGAPFRVAVDSLDRFREVVAGLGFPAALRPAQVDETTGSVLGRVDWNAFTRRSWGALAYARLARSDLAPFFAADASSGGRSRAAAAALQLVSSFYTRSDRLHETRSALSFSDRTSRPVVVAPQGRVSVGSASEAGEPGFAVLSFGGNPAFDDRERAWTWETTHLAQWYLGGGAHRPTVFGLFRYDAETRGSRGDPFGTFYYGSLAELGANQPFSYSRTVGSTALPTKVVSTALAASDLWRVSSRFQTLFGIRLEAEHFLSEPTLNPRLLDAFGVSNDHVPNRVHVSPRFGFTWAFAGEGPRLGMITSTLGSRVPRAVGVLRGGIGEFRGSPDRRAVSAALAETGLPGSPVWLRCFGDAVPTPLWENDVAGPGECRAGTTAAEELSRSVTLLGRGYEPPRSWRANLSWSSRLRAIAFMLDGVYSLNLDQPGATDLNFLGAERFRLASEGGRPVFVGSSEIDPRTGAALIGDSRLHTDFGRVVERGSELRSTSRQVTLTVVPDLNFSRYFLTASYTLGDVRSRSSGFDATTAADPRFIEHGPGDFDVRHQVLVQAGVVTGFGLSVTLFGRVVSGVPYSPIVAGDVNGDGWVNDRAFVFSSGNGADGTGEGLRNLLATAPGAARGCLHENEGRIFARNACRGPWSAALNARAEFASPIRGTANRATVAITLSNPLGGLDRLVNGSGHLRGWGTSGPPDPVLYYVRGFDSAAGQYRYAVNPAFGQARGGQPFRVSVDVRVDVGRPLPVQQLERVLRPARGAARPPADSVVARYRRQVPNVYAQIMGQSDSLLLSGEQVAVLQAAEAVYRAHVDAVWQVHARYLASLPERFDAVEALRRQEAAIDTVWEIGREQAETIRGILSPLQMTMLPGNLQFLFSARGRVQIRSYTR